MNAAGLLESTEVDQIRVLLVEDSPDHQVLTRHALQQAGIHVTVAPSGEAALSMLDSHAGVFHLVLVDQGLPQMSGMEVMARVVAIPDGPGVVMVTASSASDLVIDAMRMGAIDFVAKEEGYLSLLPAVVERAHRQYDLRVRTSELQRLALLVNRSSRLDETVHEVVAGATKLLRATAAVLLVERPSSSHAWDALARIGDPATLPESMAQSLAALESDDVADGVLTVRLPSEPDEPAGVLLVARSSGRAWLAEDRTLARTFAAFVSSALRHVRRAELEGGLIEELEHTIRVRRDFVASISHELRTPLTSIGGYAETLLARVDQIQPAQQVDLLERIRRNATQLERMIDQLIDVARLERGERFAAQPGPLELATFVRQSVADLEGLLVGRSITVDVPDVSVLADSELGHRVLSNLLINAGKYSPPGAPILVHGTVEGDRVRLVVRDHGIGIDPADAQKIFQPFWRAGYAVAQAVRGTGIGLALVREYVHGMGGEVGVRPAEDGDGSEFWFTLPLLPG